MQLTCLRFVLILLAINSSANAQSPNPQTTGLDREAAIAQWPALPRLDRARLERAGLRVVEGKYLTLITDLPASREIDELPKIADAAVPKLRAHFELPARSLDRWRVRACLMQNDETFIATELLPGDRAEFPNGLSVGYRLWLHEQTTADYRRHLLLHELTHSFMATQLGGCGPGWYMESMAEHLGTHTWNAETGEVTLGVMPTNRDGFAMWGRTKLVRDAIDAGRGRSITVVMKTDNTRALTTEEYAWCWALAKLLDTHPRFQARWRSLAGNVLDPDFDKRFYATFADDWSHLDSEWRLFTTQLDYGYDIKRETIDFKFGRPLVGPQSECKIATDRGWQSTGWLVEAGRRYKLVATRQFIVSHEPDGTPWPCSADGVTLDYHDGRPLGQLLATVDPRTADKVARQLGTNAFWQPTPLGTDVVYEPTASGTLYLRVNDSPAKLAENEGELAIEIRRLP